MSFNKFKQFVEGWRGIEREISEIVLMIKRGYQIKMPFFFWHLLFNKKMTISEKLKNNFCSISFQQKLINDNQNLD